MSYAFKLVAVGVAVLILGGFAMYLFSALWLQVGLGAAIAVVVGGLLFYAWRVDRRDKAAREGLERA